MRVLYNKDWDGLCIVWSHGVWSLFLNQLSLNEILDTRLGGRLIRYYIQLKITTYVNSGTYSNTYILCLIVFISIL